MKIESAEPLAPTAEGLRNIVRMAYFAGLAKGRGEKRELKGRPESAVPSATPSDSAGHSQGEDSLRHWIAAAINPYEQNPA